MTEIKNVEEDSLIHRLNSETARIPWKELQTFFATGKTIKIDNTLDLIKTAKDFVEDNATNIKSAMSKGLIAPVSDDQAQDWLERDTELWALVISPWVLVQETKPETLNQ